MRRKFAYFTGILLSASLLMPGCSLRENAEDNPSVQTQQAETSETVTQNTQEVPSPAVTSTEPEEPAESNLSAQPAAGNSDDAPFSATMLDVGQGLSILIQADGHNMLYDGGDRAHSSYVLAYLNEHKIYDLDYIVASHYDEDHIAGLVGALKRLDVGTVICPDYQADSKIYQSFINRMDESEAEAEHPDAGTEYMLGDAKVEIIRDDPSAEDENNRSIVVKVSYGSFSMLLTGDSEQEAEDEMIDSGMDLHVDLYVAGHHGSSSSSSQEFLSAVKPYYAWISCELGNSYGHPHKETMERLKDNDIQIFRSDWQEEVSVYSDGVNYWFSTMPSDDWRCGNEEPGSRYSDEITTDDSSHGLKDVDSAFGVTPDTENTADSGQTVAEETYVLNTHTMKFHRPDCDAVAKMSESNKEESSLSRKELIAEGYSPCGSCRP